MRPAEGRAGRADAEGAGAARDRRTGSAGRTSASRNSCARRWRRSNAHEDPEAIARQVRELQQQWRQAADVPRAQGEALWRRFKAAHDEVWARCEAHFAAQAAGAGRESREEDRARASRPRRSPSRPTGFRPPTRSRRCRPSGRRSARCRAARKRRSGSASAPPAIGSSPAATTISRKRKAVWAENLAKKDALCARPRRSPSRPMGRGGRRDQAAAGRVEDDRPGEEEPVGSHLAALPRARAIASSPATRSGTTSRAPNGWRRAKRSAPSSRRSRRPPASRRRRQAPRRRSRPPSSLAQVRERCAAAGSRRLAARGVDRERARRARRALRRRLRSRASRAGRRRSPAPISIPTRTASAWRRSSSGSRSSPRRFGGAGAPPTTALSPTTRLAAMLKEALAANTIGGKVDDESRWRAAQEDVRQAQASWSRIGPVPEAVRRALADRFQRACRRITERQPERPGWKAGGQWPGRARLEQAGIGRTRRLRAADPCRPDPPVRRLARAYLVDLDQLDVEHQHAVRRRSDPCRRASRESRSASSRLRPSAARPSVQPAITPSSGNVAGSPRMTELSNSLPSVVQPE